MFSGAQNHSSTNPGAQYGSTTFRRVWGQWTRKTDSVSNPKITMNISYNHGNSLCENCVLTWNSDPGQGSLSEPEAVVFGVRRLDTDFPINVNVRLLGSIFYVLGSAIFEPFYVLRVNNSGGLGFDGLTFRDLVVYIEPGFHPTRQALRLENSNPAASALVAENILSVSPVAALIQSQWQTQNVSDATTLSAALAGLNGSGSVWERLPGLCTRYVNGALTSAKLWPWPMNQRIIDAMTAAGRTPVDVTAQVETLFGTIPAACKE
jgi:hypothetical protein